jgi:uncharacterized protein
MHHRLTPKENRFEYNIFMFYVDVDELDMLDKNSVFFSLNSFNWFTIRDDHHFQFPDGKKNNLSIRENITAYLRANNINSTISRIMLLTNAAVFGYAFNPISVYLCFGKNNEPLCSIAEVCNTHEEMKMYLLVQEDLQENTFDRQHQKHFYVSPFTDLRAHFRFIFKIPAETLMLRVDDYEDGKRFLVTSLSGEKKTLSEGRLLWYAFRFPFITLKIIFLIHWQALILKLKGVPWRDKKYNLHLQRDMFNYKKA